MGLFDWLSRHRAATAIPDALWERTVASFPFLAVLSDEEKSCLKAMTEHFLASKRFTTVSGLELTDEICVAIAAQGCLPILHLGLSAYADWVGVVVYPDEFVVPRVVADDAGIVHEYDDILAGEAWEGGPLVVSWRDVQMAQAAENGYNVVIHEFAHKLDMLNGEADGIPALHSGLGEAEWLTTFDAAYEDFCRRVDAAEIGDDEMTLDAMAIDPYGAESPAEFFAVISEAFFGDAQIVADTYPALYDLLRRYYRQDPLARFTRSNSASITAAS